MDERSGIVFHQLLRAHHNAAVAALTERGLGDIGSPHLLVALSHYPEDPAQAPTQRELADRLHMAPPTIAASLKCLERQGYVARRTDERDSRRNRISITQKGRDALDSGMQAFQQVRLHTGRAGAGPGVPPAYAGQSRPNWRRSGSRALSAAPNFPRKDV